MNTERQPERRIPGWMFAVVLFALTAGAVRAHVVPFDADRHRASSENTDRSDIRSDAHWRTLVDAPLPVGPDDGLSLPQSPAFINDTDVLAWRPGSAEELARTLSSANPTAARNAEMLRRLYRQFAEPAPSLPGAQSPDGGGSAADAAARDTLNEVLTDVLTSTRTEAVLETITQANETLSSAVSELSIREPAPPPPELPSATRRAGDPPQLLDQDARAKLVTLLYDVGTDPRMFMVVAFLLLFWIARTVIVALARNQRGTWTRRRHRRHRSDATMSAARARPVHGRDTPDAPAGEGGLRHASAGVEEARRGSTSRRFGWKRSRRRSRPA